MPGTLDISPETTPGQASQPGVRPNALLSRKIVALRRRHVSVAVLTGLAIGVSVAVELLALEIFADWWLELPWISRLLLLILQGALFAGILFRLVLLPLLRQPDDDEVALMVEKARPKFRSRLIASLQLTRPGAIPPGSSAELVGALIAETQAMAREIDFRPIVPTERLKKFGAMAAMVLLIGIIGVAAGRETAWDLLKRAFLSHISVPRKTRILVQDGDKIVGIGDNVRL